MTPPADVCVRMHKGRPTVHIDGAPVALTAYSPISWRGDFMRKAAPAFFGHGLTAYWLGIPQAADAAAWGDSPLWDGDTITALPQQPFVVDLDAQAAFLLDGDPDAWLLIRNGPLAPPSWRALHPEDLFVTQEGDRLDVPSWASRRYWEACAEGVQAVVGFCEGRPWAHRILGHWYGMDGEGTHPALIDGWLYDHSPVMVARWRTWLSERYRRDAAYADAHAQPGARIETAVPPRFPVRGGKPGLAPEPYWPDPATNAPLRDYLDCLTACVHEGMAGIFAAQRAATGRQRIYLTDAFKQPMAGWTNRGFFDPDWDWPVSFPETVGGSGSMRVAELLDHPGLDGVVTPMDYQLRGVGGVSEPEGCADSVVLRGKLFMAEWDMRTFHDDRERGSFGTSPTIEAWRAVNWRNVASALTRGYAGYWMDLVGDWYGDAEIQADIAAATEVMRAARDWPHSTPPGIAVVLDDTAMRDTNGDGRVLNEALLWELKIGLARCGVPYRIYLWDDLALDAFPGHRVFYFPNLHRVDADRLALLRERVFRDGRVVVWGPGSGITDGAVRGADSVRALTGFNCTVEPRAYTRRVHVRAFDHAVTQGLPADVIYGSPLAYGPMVYPTDGHPLGVAWAKAGRECTGLAVKTMDGGTWHSVFTTAVPMPADLWRNLARFAGAHVYCEANEVLMAGGELVALHSVRPGTQELRLPAPATVAACTPDTDFEVEGARLRYDTTSPTTRLFHMTAASRPWRAVRGAGPS